MSAYPERPTDAELDRRENVTQGLHMVEPEPDFSKQYEEQEAGNTLELEKGSKGGAKEEKIKAVTLALLAKNKGRLRQTSRQTGVPERKIAEWKREHIKNENPFAPAVLSKNTKLEQSSKKLNQLINTIIDALPEQIQNASLKEQVDALAKLVSIKSDLDALNNPRKTPDEMEELLRRKAQERLKKKPDVETQQT